jgi:8-oxo-dGTP pyrophosphatase MutT (NUDIX family)
VTERFRVVPAVYVLFLRGDEVLLQLRRGTGFLDDHWAAGAAGHVEAGESVFAAAVREAREELDVVVDAADLEPLGVLHRTAEPHGPVDERVDFFFACRHWSGDPRRAEEDRAAELRWFRLGDLPVPVVPHELRVLGQLRAGHVDPIAVHGFEPRTGAVSGAAPRR